MLSPLTNCNLNFNFNFFKNIYLTQFKLNWKFSGNKITPIEIDYNIKNTFAIILKQPVKLNIFNENWVSLFWWNGLSFKNLFFINSNLFYSNWYSKLYISFLNAYKRTVGDGLLYVRGLFLIFFIDACLTDDEPIWEPVEWSLIQTWLLFLFIFSWIAENLITSRYGSYTGRDKRIWYSWYRSFWGIEFFFFMSLGAASMFVIVPFYFESWNN
mgnify:CR=1 FL=1